MDSLTSSIMPPAGSTISGEVDALFSFILYTSTAILALVTGAIIFFVIKYRRRGDAVRTSGVDHNLALEITWTVLPLILIVIVFVWGFETFVRMHIVPANAMEIKVTAQQWFWSFEYPNGATSVNDLVVPVDQPIKLLMSSRDVIHSFFVPDFRTKMDVLPNRYSIAWFEATRAGEYVLFCTEFCGKGHSKMTGKVTVLSDSAYNVWLEEGSGQAQGESLADYGGRLFTERACITCHRLDGKADIGPSLAGLFGKTEVLEDGSSIEVDENYLRESLLEPSAKVTAGFKPIMPTYQGILKDRDIDALIEFMKSLEKN